MKEDVLEVLFMEEPHLEGLGDSVISSVECAECGEQCVYNGPNIEFTDVGRCMVCGTINEVMK